jgi:hypothetical protein
VPFHGLPGNRLAGGQFDFAFAFEDACHFASPLFLDLFRDFQPKILEQNISGCDRAGSPLHYAAQLVLSNAGFLGYPVACLAAALDMFSDGLDNHTDNHIFDLLHLQYKPMLGRQQVISMQEKQIFSRRF